MSSSREVQIDGEAFTIDAEYTHIAQDKEGDVCVYEIMPELTDETCTQMWGAELTGTLYRTLTTSEPIFKLDWKDSLMTIEEFIRRSEESV